LRAELAAEGVVDLEEIEARLDQDALLRSLRGLEGARSQQQEDWASLGIFLLFLSGADAFVSAHLRRFPEPLEVGAQPGAGGGVELSLRLRLPN
jgi:hypothetical protein